jgi:hypothetical protein
MRSSQGLRLDSWKAIADYLGRNVRTVTRWADERGLPIHRVPGGKRRAVFAYKDEIDAWLNSPSSSHVMDVEAEESEIEVPRSSGSGNIQHVSKLGHKLLDTRTFKWFVLLGSFCVLALFWVFGIVSVNSHISAALRPLRFVQMTDDGFIKQNLRTDERALYFNEDEGNRRVLRSVPLDGGPIRQIPLPFANVSVQDISGDEQSLLVTSFEGIEDLQPLWTIPMNGGEPTRVGNARCHHARWSPDYRSIACSMGKTVVVLNSEGSSSGELATFRSSPSKLEWASAGKLLRLTLQDSSSQTDSPWEVEIGQNGALSAPHELPLENCCVGWTWTRDGKYLMYAKPDGDNRSSIIIKSLSGVFSGRFIEQAELPVKVGKVHEISLGKTDTRIYMLVSNAQRGELLKFDLKQNVFQTFLPGLSAMYLSYSRDGKWISYMALDNTLWRSRSDGSDRVQLVAAPMQAQLSSWSPDGSEIAFMGKQSGKPWRIFMIGRDGGLPEEAATGDDDQGAPTWSPDGKRLVYANVHGQSVACGVHFVELATRIVEALPASCGLRTARWSPDGKHIAALQPESHEVMLFDVVTRQWEKLAGSVNGDDINWTHDSRYVLVDSPQGEKPVIDRIRVADGRRSTVVNLASLQQMPGEVNTWFGLTPDDSPILLHLFTGSEIYALDWTNR